MSILVHSGKKSSAIDLLRSTDSTILLQVAGVIGFAVLTALGAQVRLYLFGLPVPFSLQTLAVYGSGLFLGTRNGALAQSLYLVTGLFFPVFAGDGYGASYLFAAASAGYLLAFPVVAALVGYCSSRWTSPAGNAVSLFAGSLVLFTFGVSWLHFVLPDSTWLNSVYQGWIVFIPYDIVKIILVAGFYSGLRHMTRRSDG